MGPVSSFLRPRRSPDTTEVDSTAINWGASGHEGRRIDSTHNCLIIPLVPRLDDFLRLVHYVVYDYIIVVDYFIERTAWDILQRGFMRVAIMGMSLFLTRSMLVVIMGHIRPSVRQVRWDKWQLLVWFDWVFE